MNVTKDCKSVWAPSYLSLLSVILGTVLCLLITVGNLIIITAVAVDPLKKLRSPFNYFVVNLAVADLIVGIISMPIGIYHHSQEYLGKKSTFRLFEKFFHMSLFTSLTASLLCLITLSVDRYIAITHAVKYRNNVAWKKCWIGSFIIWILSLSLPFVYIKTGYIDFLMIYINTAVVIAAVTLIMIYIRLFKFLQAQIQKMKDITKTTTNEKSMLEMKRKFQQKRVTRVFLWVLILFLACYFPGAIVVYVLQLCTECTCEVIHITRDIAFYLITINSCMNPFVYAFKNKHYKQAAYEIWTRSRIKLSSQTSIASSRKTSEVAIN